MRTVTLELPARVAADSMASTFFYSPCWALIQADCVLRDSPHFLASY